MEYSKRVAMGSAVTWMSIPKRFGSATHGAALNEESWDTLPVPRTGHCPGSSRQHGLLAVLQRMRADVMPENATMRADVSYAGKCNSERNARAYDMVQCRPI